MTIVSWVDAITDSMDMSLSKFWEMVKDREAWHATVQEVAKRVGHDRATKTFTFTIEHLLSAMHHARPFSFYFI